MQTVLFTTTIFGPIHSRRLGASLGVNLSPRDGKICTFDCLYCEAGFNAQGPGTSGLPSREEVRAMLENKLRQMHDSGQLLDTITFSGNGEPTVHPDFPEIVDDVLELRDRYYPQAVVSVLCNSTRLSDKKVTDALLKVDNAILKLDSAVDATMRLIDRPGSPAFNTADLIDRLARLSDKIIVQTMMLRGSYEGHVIDNTTDEEVQALCDAYRLIRPREVMLYSIDRKTPAEDLQKIPAEELESIAGRFRSAGIKVQVN